MSDRDDRPIFERRVTRRGFVGGGLALIGGSLLAACGGGGGQSASTTSGGASTAAAVTTAGSTGPASTGGTASGGTLQAAYSASFDRIGTTLWGGTGFTIGYAAFNRLLRLSDDGKSLAPELAEAMPEISSDGTVYTFKLRQGVKFHDESEMTADDVKFTLERQINPATKADAQSLYAGFGIAGTKAFVDGKAKEISGLRVVDPSTLEMTLDAPNSSVAYALSMTMASIVPKAYIEKVGDKVFEFQKPIGTGPYLLSSYANGKQMVLRRFDGYFDPGRAGHVDEVDFQFNLDPNLGFLRIQRDQLDIMQDPVPTGMLNQLRNDPNEKDDLKIGTVNNVFYVTNSTKHPALKDLRVRQAVAYAIDKEKIVRQLGGVDKIADGGLFSPLSPYYQSGLTPGYDPEKAKSLLALAGFKNGFDLNILSQPVDPQKTIAQAVQADLTAVGIQAKAKIMPQDAWLQEVFKYGPDMVVSQWELPYPHGSYIMDSAFTKAAIDGGCCNFSSWTDPKFESLVKQAHEATDPTELTRLYREMDALAVGQELLWIPVIYPGYAALKSTRLQGYEVPGTPAGDVLFFDRYSISQA